MTWKEKLLKAIKGKDEGTAIALLDEAPEDGKLKTETHVHVHTRDEDKEDEDDKDKGDDTRVRDRALDALDARVGKVEDAVSAIAKDVKSISDAIADADKEEEEEEEEEGTEDEQLDFGAEAPPGTGDRAWARTRDSAFMEDSFQETVALAEIIAPGVRVPTFDAKADRKKTYDALCQFRRRVLDTADRDPETHVFIDSLTGGRRLDQLKSCSDVRTIFRSVGTFKKNANNADQSRRAAAADSFAGTAAGMGVKGEIRTPAQLNKRLAEIYKNA